MARVKHEIRLDLSGVDLAALKSVADFRRAARKLLPAALDDLGQAMGEVAWLRRQADESALRLGGKPHEMTKFVAEAGKRYRRHAPVEEREALEELIMLRLQQAKTSASARRQQADSTVTLPAPLSSGALARRNREQGSSRTG